MNPVRISRLSLVAAVCLYVFGAGPLAAQTIPQANSPPSPGQRVEMLKQWLRASQAQLRSYEWIETTVISKDGEEKKRLQNRCYYGVDGKLQKVPVGGGAAQEDSSPAFMPPLGRLARKAAEHKKEELADYMKRAKALIESYVPPSPDRIQLVVNAGKMAINPVAPGQRVRLDFRDYLKPGDVLSVDLELPTNRLLGISVTSYMEQASDVVSLNVSMGVLPDGTIYTAHSTLTARAKELTVVMDNTGHRHAAN